MSQLVDYEWKDVNNAVSEEQEINFLVDIVSKSIIEKDNQAIMVFAESKKTVDKICEALRKAEIKNLPYYQDVGVQGRANTL